MKIKPSFSRDLFSKSGAALSGPSRKLLRHEPLEDRHLLAVDMTGGMSAGMSGALLPQEEYDWLYRIPDDVANKDAPRDFTFTATRGGVSLSIPVHVAYAEVVVQFAGEGDFVERTAVGGQTAQNTIVVGQKVKAKVETSDKVFLDNTYGVEWAHPSGGNAVYDYITNDSQGRIVQLSGAYFNNGDGSYYTDLFEFYYTSNTTSKLGGLNATFNLRDVNGKYYYGVGAGAGYYVDKPTVTSFTSQFAQFSDGGSAIRIWPDEDDLCLRFGGWDSIAGEAKNGITWTAQVNPTPYAGGQIAYTQLIDTFRQYVLADDSHAVQSSQGQYYLDHSFPYGNKTAQIGSTLVASDSPAMKKLNDEIIDAVMAAASDAFQTYLMYQPSGNDCIWVSLSMLTWEWNAAAQKQLDETWVLFTSLCHYSASSSANTSVLPVWKGNADNIPFIPWEKP